MRHSRARTGPPQARAACAALIAVALACTSTRGRANDRLASRAPDYWPTSAWREATPEAHGVDSERLAELFDFVARTGVNVHSLLVVRHGYVILDASFFPYDGASPHDLASCTKSVTATLVGAAIQAGRIRSVHDRVLSYFPEHRPAHLDDRKRELAIEDLLTMRGGLECEDRGGEPTLRAMRASPNWAHFMLDRPMVEAPGRKFVYCSGGVHLLSALLARATGRSPAEFARHALFEPLGIEHVIWPTDPQGVNFGWGDLHLTVRDMAKIGLLYLHGGEWDGRRILPASFVAAATSPRTRTGLESRYGYGWWIAAGGEEGEFEAVGRGGQRISVVPRADLVVVFTGGGRFDPKDLGTILGRALVSDHALPENPQGVARLRAAMARAAQPPRGGPPEAAPTEAAATAVSETEYRLAANPLGLEAFTLRFASPGRESIRVRFADGRDETHSVGTSGAWKISSGGQFGLAVAIRGRWEPPTTLVLEYDTIANINRYTMRLVFDDEHVQVQVREEGSASPVLIDGVRPRDAQVPFGRPRN
jgi:CubicO group peptidase (beta-lactamase class C family)